MRLRLGLIGAAVLLTALASCGGLLTYDPMEFPLESRIQTGPARSLFSEMEADQDPVISDLGRALAKLPDFHDGVSDREMKAARLIEKTAREARGKARERLAEISTYSADPPQYSAALQGLLWMAEDGKLRPGLLKSFPSKSLIAYAFSRLQVRCNTPQKILDYLASSYSYVLNRNASQGLYGFFVGKHGDCNEFSLLAGYLLERQGLDVWILHLKPSIWGRHVAVIFKQQDGYYLMDASRAAILRVLDQRKEREPLQPVDLQVRDLIEGFDRIHGPVRNRQDLVGLYNGGRPDDMDFRIESFKTYKQAVDR